MINPLNITDNQPVTIFSKANDGSIANYSVDAVLEETLDMSADVTTYPIESGANVADHRIIQPIRYKIKGVVSNNPIKVSVTDFAGGLVSNLVSNPVVAAAAGLGAGYLSGMVNGSNSTRAQTALKTFVEILEGEKSFDVVGGDITLKNMVITNISRTRVPENENALVFDLDLQEMVTLDRLDNSGQPDHSYLRSGDPSQAGCAKDVSKGTTTLTDSSASASSEVATMTA